VRRAGVSALLAGALALTACGQDEKPAPTASPATGTAASSPPASAAAGGNATQGKQVWLAQCVVCHNVDPSKDGAIGPAVKGASRELLEARVVHGSYPPGYTPKRQTKVMPARPDLAGSVPDLYAYLR